MLFRVFRVFRGFGFIPSSSVPSVVTAWFGFQIWITDVGRKNRQSQIPNPKSQMAEVFLLSIQNLKSKIQNQKWITLQIAKSTIHIVQTFTYE